MVLTEPKVVKVSDVAPIKVDNAEKTWIRVLISTSEGLTYAMRVFEMERGGHIPAHKHPWEHEIFVLDGKVRIRVEDKTFDLEPEYAIYIPPNKIHEYWNIGETKARFICVIPVKPSV
ncbi:MAG TPA: cupin domain-containing protein [Ignisphaera sp.]|nr:cupin domain-containing protein [Ignisphaera sp.]